MTETTSSGAVPDFSKGRLIASFDVGGKHCDLLENCPTAGAENIPDGLKFHFRFCLLLIEPNTKSLVGVLSHEVSMFGTEAISYMDNTGQRSSFGQVSPNTSPKNFLEIALNALAEKNGMFTKQEINSAIQNISLEPKKSQTQQDKTGAPPDPNEVLEKIESVKKFIAESTHEPRKFNQKIVGVILVLALGLSAIWYMFTPHNYDDCILKNLKAGMSDAAAVSIRSACLNKFVKTSGDETPSCKDRLLTPEERKQIKGSAHITNYGYFEANVYNGNSGFAVKDFVVLVEDVATGSKYEYKTYGYKVEPLTTGEIKAKLVETPSKKFDWSVVSAMTCQ